MLDRLPVLSLAGVLVLVAGFLLASPRGAAPQGGGGPIQVGCKCKAEVSLGYHFQCPCSLILTNLTTSRMGRCTMVVGGGGQLTCNGPSTLFCKVAGTVSETGPNCVGGVVDLPFSLEKECVPDKLTSAYFQFPCTGDPNPKLWQTVALGCYPCRIQ